MDEIDAANFAGHFHRFGSSFFLRLGRNASRNCQDASLSEKFLHFLDEVGNSAGLTHVAVRPAAKGFSP